MNSIITSTPLPQLLKAIEGVSCLGAFYINALDDKRTLLSYEHAEDLFILGFVCGITQLTNKVISDK